VSVRLEAATVADEALVSMVRGAVAAVEGARLDRPSRIARVLPGRRGAVEWQLDGGAISFDVDVSVTYGAVLPDVARRVRESVAGAVSGMTGLRVSAVDVTVTTLDRGEQ
jgi:uncharacterized alkaline shock family protein YloU